MLLWLAGTHFNTFLTEIKLLKATSDIGHLIRHYDVIVRLLMLLFWSFFWFLSGSPGLGLWTFCHENLKTFSNP